MTAAAVRLVVMPGLDGTGLLLKDFAEAMGKRCPVEVLRYPPEMTGYDALAPWVLARLPEGPHVLLAESFSGPLAVEVAKARPGGLKGVIFLASFIRAPMPVPGVAADVLKTMPLNAPVMQALLRPFTTGIGVGAAVTEAFRAALEEVPPATIAGRLRQVLDTDLRDDLAALHVPHACISARNDRLVPPGRANELCRGACHVARLEGPHFLAQVHPEEVAQAVVACLEAMQAW
ncbi:alpha/beta fold hydrolase [Vannielia litorea]|uniref:alpha/beta fold hydrolase n=1 Tax=Vannielia litorea TaxID=1217970 RepID=UPI001BCD118E|nr:alpha/beta hydrolase [Vannielia litorea]MBS8226082.1 alpha/beta hydrolase [Vannielia litorea]